MERTTEPISFSSFRGLNTKLSEISISTREASALQNIELTRETIDVRAGNDTFTTTQLIEGGAAKAVTGITQGVLASTVYQLVTGGSKIYSLSDAGVLTDITGAAVITDDPNNFYSFAKFKDSSGNDIFIASNGVDTNKKWTGSGNIADLAGTPPANFKHLLVRKNRLYGSSGEFVYHSDLLNGESWDPLFWVARIVSSNALYTNEVTGLVKFGDNIAIFKEDLISLFSGENFTEGFVQEVVSGDGCISGFTPFEILSRRYGNIIVFVNRNNEIKGFNGTKDLIHISDPIDLTLRRFTKDRIRNSLAVDYKSKNQYYCSFTTTGSTHNKIIAYDYYLDGYDQRQETPESTMLIHSGITANALAVMNINGEENLFTGTYDGWVLKHGSASTDIEKASQIAPGPTGLIRASNFVSCTTLLPHGFSIGDSITISNSSISSGGVSFDGTFIISTVTSTTFSFGQVAVNGTGGGGIAKKKVKINAYWQSKKEAFGNVGKQKLLNDFNHVTNLVSTGQIRTTINTDSGQGQQTNTVSPVGAFFGDDAIFGVATFGGSGVTYSRVELETGINAQPLYGRYFKVRFDNVDGFRFSLEEYIMGVHDLGYQAEYRA